MSEYQEEDPSNNDEQTFNFVFPDDAEKLSELRRIGYLLEEQGNLLEKILKVLTSGNNQS